MSVSTLGIPMPFGLTHGYNTDYSINTFLNSMPIITTFKYYKNLSSVQTLSDLESYDTSLLINGDSIIVKNDPSNNISNAQYFWTGEKWIKIGALNCPEFINIYSCTSKTVDDELKIDKEEFYMRTHFNSIQSNIKLMQLLRSDFGVNNNDIITFCGLNGSYNMNLNEQLKSLLEINITNGINNTLKNIFNKYNVPYIFADNLIKSIINSIYSIIEESNTLFYQLSREVSKIDISMYSNYLSACYSSFKYILESRYEKVSTIIFNNDVELQLIDQNFYDRIQNNDDIKLFAQEFLQIINDITYSTTDSSSFFFQLNALVNYFDWNNTHIIRIKKNRIQLYKDLCDGIAGVINLALLFSLISNCTYGSSNSIYFHFIAPEKFLNYE